MSRLSLPMSMPAALLLAGPPLLGPTLTQAEEATEIDPVVVTATRTARTVNASLASVSVIDRADIERLQARSVPDLLRGVQGLQVSNSGGAGKVTELYLRGTSADHVLVLIDGVKIGSATTGTTAWQDLPIDRIERIEVVRGPRSSLYGSEAIGGVIQIFTRKGGGALKPSLSLGGGSYRSANASADLSGGGDQGWWNVGLGYADTQGFNACDGTPLGAGCFTFEPDRDGYRNLSGSARGGYRFGDRGELDLFWLGTNAQSRFDGDFVNDTKTEQQVLGANGQFSPLDPWNLTLALGQSRDDSDNRLNGGFVTRFDTTRDTGSLQSDLTLGAGRILTIGLDYQEDHIESTEDYAEDARRNVGVFGEAQTSFRGHDLSASLRQDDNQQFGTHATGSAAWGTTLASGLRLLATYGTAFKAPTFNELYFPFFGNPDLVPEQSRSAELGAAGGVGPLLWSVNAYQTDVDDLIAFGPAFIPENIDRARIRGLELGLSGRVADWSLNANLTLLDPINKSQGPDDGNLLPRRAEQSARLDLDRSLGRWGLGGSLIGVGRRFDDTANTLTLDPYITVDLRAEYAFTKDWRLQGRLENLLDADYETAAYYNQPGRGLYVTLRYEP
jgi:vitamin B12 transporter